MEALGTAELLHILAHLFFLKHKGPCTLTREFFFSISNEVLCKYQFWQKVVKFPSVAQYLADKTNSKFAATDSTNYTAMLFLLEVSIESRQI